MGAAFRGMAVEATEDKPAHITPMKLFAETNEAFSKLCVDPAYQSYYAAHLLDDDYYHYGSAKLFAKIQAKDIQRK